MIICSQYWPRPNIAPKRAKISVDLRNHGQSPHVPASDMTYEAMSEDLISVLDSHGIEKACLLGHSLGGKVAMQTALTNPTRVSELIVVDIAPIPYAPSKNAADASVAANAMVAVDLRSVQSRQDADTALAKNGVDIESVRSFLLTNLTRVTDSSANTRYKWKSNVHAIREALPVLRDFPPHKDKTYVGRTCLIRGGNSRYVPFQSMLSFTKRFPNTKLITISDAGHWVHSQRPEEFCRSVNDFLADP